MILIYLLVLIFCIIFYLYIYQIDYDFFFIDNQLQVAIVSTVRNPHQIHDWIRYHLNFGVSKIFLILDDEKEDINNKFGNRVEIFKNDKIWKNKLKTCNQYSTYSKSFNSEVMSRQILNIEYILKHCQSKGINWLIHIDADEILYSPKYDNIKDILIKLDDRVNIINIDNYELAPTESNANNCFRTHTHFKTRVNGNNFVAYYNGKSGCKVSNDIHPYGVHEFKSNISDHKEKISEKDLVVLHYVNCNFKEWKNKYKILGNFNDTWWNNVRIPFSMHKKSRDVVMNHLNDESKLLNIYNEMIYDHSKLNDELKDGRIAKIDKVKHNLLGI